MARPSRRANILSSFLDDVKPIDSEMQKPELPEAMKCRAASLRTSSLSVAGLPTRCSSTRAAFHGLSAPRVEAPQCHVQSAQAPSRTPTWGNLIVNNELSVMTSQGIVMLYSAHSSYHLVWGNLIVNNEMSVMSSTQALKCLTIGALQRAGGWDEHLGARAPIADDAHVACRRCHVRNFREDVRCSVCNLCMFLVLRNGARLSEDPYAATCRSALRCALQRTCAKCMTLGLPPRSAAPLGPLRRVGLIPTSCAMATSGRLPSIKKRGPGGLGMPG